MMDNNSFVLNQRQVIEDLKRKYEEAKSRVELSALHYCENPLDEKIFFDHYQSLLDVQILYRQLLSIYPDDMSWNYLVVADSCDECDRHAIYWNSNRSTWTLDDTEATHYPLWSEAERNALKEARHCLTVDNKSGTIKNIRVIARSFFPNVC